MALSSGEMTLRMALVVLAFCGCKDREPAPPAAGGSGAGVGSAAARPTRTGTGPNLAPITDAAPGGTTPRQQFTDEPRDDAWADATEQAIIDRVGDLDDGDQRDLFVECKTTQCRIDVRSPETDGLGATIARFEDQAGLRGIAQSMYIDMEPEGRLGERHLVVYATFKR
jgi:hypothetical protein